MGGARKKMQSEFFVTVEAVGGVGIVRELLLDSEKFICFTRFSQEERQWVLGISEGISAWRAELTEDKVKELGQELTSTVKGISQALQDGETQLLGSHDNLKLRIQYSTSKHLELPLCQSPVDVKVLVFSLWDSLQSTKRKLKACENSLLAVEKAKIAPISSDGTVSGGTAGKASTSKQKKTKGASLVNPSSKRRKAAKGVVFDGDN